MPEIIISTRDLSLRAELNDSPTAQQIWKSLPIEGSANVWGDEIYFEIPVKAGQEPDARQDVEVGELGYWPAGNAFCIFYGPTPVSTSSQPRAYSPVNIIGRVIDDATRFRGTNQGTPVQITAAGEP
jgi:hypothetical protein